MKKNEIKKMRKTTMNKIKLILLIIATGTLLTACQPDESGKLENRVKAYWQHKINKEFDKAYEFTSPAYKRLNSKQAFIILMINNKLQWQDMKIVKKQCKRPDLCLVKMSIKYKYKFKGLGTGGAETEVETPLSERWIMKDNVWYVTVKQSNL